MNLRIEEHCHENWNAMTPREQGRHCDKCCKTVVDFTHMPTDEVIQYIASKKKDSVCGRFTAGQVQVPAVAKTIPAISWTFKKFLAALVLVFGGALFTGCGNEETVGKLVAIDHPNENPVQTESPDTIIPKASVKDTVPLKADTIKHLKGKVSCQENPPKEVIYYNGGVTVEQPTIVGLTALVPEVGDTIK
ncbi:MAG: hypothetical protein M3R17_09455 [Bacteroidota bacterium]|nr:hypothetical protein [Bacteroidota bacterium]